MSPSKILRFLGRNALLGAALLATLAASAVLTMRVVLTSRDVAVPSLAGRVLADANALAGSRGLALRIEGRRHDTTVPADHVVAQEPPPGATLKAQIERAWTVVRLEDGVLLVPRRAGSAIGGVEIKGSRIAVDGNAVSREALRQRFGADVDPVLALVDLTEAERLAALGLAEHESVPAVDQHVSVHEWPAARTRHTGANLPAIASEQMMFDPFRPVMGVLPALVIPIYPPTAFLGR